MILSLYNLVTKSGGPIERGNNNDYDVHQNQSFYNKFISFLQLGLDRNALSNS